jgi:tRNA-2-methylthio-N6-dimethylallyladenosine synthase
MSETAVKKVDAKKVYLETFGCQMNVSDSERVATMLEKQGYEMTLTEESADVVLFNTCSVREKAEHKLYTRVGEVRQKAQNSAVPPLVGVMGCVAQLEGETLFSREGIDFVIGTQAVGRVHEAIEAVSRKPKPYLDLAEREFDYDWSVSTTQMQSPYIAFVPIIEGCNKFCTYCIVPFSRGRERSLPAVQIVREVTRLKDAGVKEVHLIGQNVNSYRPKANDGLENVKGATAFAKLMRAVAETGIGRVKFNTSFPRDFHPDIVDAIDEYENICNWVHLPVQSGSDRVLKLMRRGHTAENYMRRVDAIRSSPRNNTLTTDIIVGFPGETEDDFKQTLNLVEYCQYDSAYFFKYSVRPGTPAAAMEDTVSPAEKTARFLELEKMHREIQQKQWNRQVGSIHNVLVERISSSGNELTGHSTTHHVINFVGGREELMGKVVKVKITESKRNSLYGELVN